MVIAFSARLDRYCLFGHGVMALFSASQYQHCCACLNCWCDGWTDLGMIARVTLGHTGRQLAPPKVMTLAFMLFNLGAVSRVLLVDWAYMPGLWIAAICWGLSFAMYVWNYAPMLWQARVDGHPG